MKVFISRDLEKNSIFKTTLEAEGIKVEGISLIEFEAVKFDEVPAVDWIFFYSKKAVKYFYEGLSVQLPIALKYACIGESTAHDLKQYQDRIDFIGNGKPDEAASEFVKLASKQRVLFPRAKNSRQSIQKILHKNIISTDLIVYNNKPKLSRFMTDCKLLVFTSPLNVEAYFHSNQLQANQRMIAIGESTAAALRARGHCEILIANEPSERSLAKSVLDSIRRRN
ncbi:MAG: uroporphyrinogen-III synthase [Bacteroidota bacterium]